MVITPIKGAESSAIVYSLVEAAKPNSIDLYGYLFYVLSVLPHFGRSVSNERLEKLMTCSKEMQQRYKKEAQSKAE